MLDIRIMKQQKLIPIILLSFIGCLTAFFVFLPFLKPGFIATDDGEWMVIRLSAFYQSFADGQFPVRFLGRLNQNFGYPVANFLYPGFMYVGSIIHLLGFSFPDTVKIILIGSYGIGAVSVFFWLRKFFPNVWDAALGALTFLLSPYFLYDIYVRGSVGELVATSAFLFSLYCIENKRKIFLAPSIAFLLISHNTLALFYMAILLAYCIIRKAWVMIGFLVLGFLMSAFFWLPALGERSMVAFNQAVISNPFHYFPVSHLLILWSLPLCVACVYAVFKSPLRYEKEKKFFTILFLGSLFFASALSFIFWKMPTLVTFVQFPYRFLSIFSIAGVWLIAYMVSHIERGFFKKVFFCLGIAYLGYFAFQRINATRITIQPEGFYTTNEATTTVSDEYMPTWVEKIPKIRANNKLEWFKGNGEFIITYESTRKITAHVIAHEDSILQINTLYYPGWGCAIDGRPTEILYTNPHGLMRIFIPQGEHELHLEFRETVFRFLADCISFLGIMAYLGIIIRMVVIRKKSKNKKSV